VTGTKVTPPEREMLRFMARQYWGTAQKIADGIGQEAGWTQAHLRRLEKLGYVESRPETQKLYRLTVRGAKFKKDNPA
jgi:DNA-binding MarR family transcriptional regulator